MNIFLFKKQIQKLFIFTATILILFSIFPVLAADAQRGPECAVNSSNTVPTVVTDRKNVKWDEPFNIQIILAFKEDQASREAAEACKAEPDKFDFQVYLYQRNEILSTPFQPGNSVDAHFYEPGLNGATEYGFAAQQAVSIKSLGMLSLPGDLDTYGYIYAFVWNKSTNTQQRYWFPASGIHFPKISANPVAETATPLPPLPAGIQPNPSSADNDPNSLKKVEDVQVKFTSGLRSKYRVLYSEASPYNKIAFGSNGVEKINLDWADPANIITTSNKLLVPDKNYSILANPYFRNMVVGVNLASAPITDKGCVSNTFKEDCTGVIYSDNANGQESGEQTRLPAGFNPVLYNVAWAKPEFRDKTVAAGQPLGSVEFRAIPILWASRGLVVNNDWFAFIYGSKAAKFTVEVYKTEADIKLACENDSTVTDKTICADPQKMRYQVGSVVQVQTGTDQTSGGKTLYAFIVSILSTIIIWITGKIYEIFAYFIVPVINALLGVRPYQDAFVNIIYPGWLILRNLANIFFIIALLVVGMKILFQQSAAAVAMGFVRRLIIMALLVNFSLVIGQGIVAIADTVQSQFLPQNSKVIEALGTKLMVEPIQTFRSAAVGETGTLQGNTALSDTAKPIVLLVLAIAAFFSFLAIAAFLAIRIVALLILYMVSPIGYVFFVMDETKNYADKWWSEFLKYAFITPVLVFFLNIAALVATSSSSITGDVINIGDGTADELVEGAFTIITHFIVLGIIYAGMKIAMDSGVYGAKTVVGYAKKGFTGTLKAFKKPADWAGSAAKSYGQNQYERKIKGGLLDPMAYKKEWKDSTLAKNKKLMEARLMSTEGRLTPGALINDWKKSAKYLATGARFGTNSLTDEKNKLLEKAGILTDAEKDEKVDLANTAHQVAAQKAKDLELLNNGKMSVDQAQEVSDKLDADAKALVTRRKTEVDKLNDDAEELATKGRVREATAKKAEATALDADIGKQIKNALDAKSSIDSKITGARGAGEDSIVLDDPLKAQIGVVFDPEDAKKELSKTITNMEEDAAKLGLEIAEDDKLRSKYGVTNMTAVEQKRLRDEAEKIDDKIHDRKLPISLAQRDARLTREREQDKLISDIDGEELQNSFSSAMEKNNITLATAIAKKIAKEGGFDELLKDQGYKNNVEGLQKFIDEKFGNVSPQVRVQIGSEISSLAEKNGNMAIGKSTTIRNGNLVWRTQAQQSKKVDGVLSGKRPEDVAKMKKWEISRETPSGSHTLYDGAVSNFNQMNDSKLTEMAKNMSSKVARHIEKSENFKELNEKAQVAIRSAAGR